MDGEPRTCAYSGCNAVLVPHPGEREAKFLERRTCCHAHGVLYTGERRRAEGRTGFENPWEDRAPLPATVRFESVEVLPDFRPLAAAGATRVEFASGQPSSMTACGTW